MELREIFRHFLRVFGVYGGWWHPPDKWKVRPVSDSAMPHLAGVGRFELPNDGVKVRCLAAWLHPYIKELALPQ